LETSRKAEASIAPRLFDREELIHPIAFIFRTPNNTHEILREPAGSKRNWGQAAIFELSGKLFAKHRQVIDVDRSWIFDHNPLVVRDIELDSVVNLWNEQWPWASRMSIDEYKQRPVYG
jgi:hypothetical protein